ncbi:hypothetical protein G7Y89_g8657 [Cudoniella acicularis]|uniref:Uncharacterized protein n=1 Tax=Cudoniella acicularis TaxID=354080 RepID=A0A8H4W3C9_9HELO|nr:hypothetical protein G7Y89_g8657 [Cudoniella acicularis]
MDKVRQNMADVERKLGKANAIADKGDGKMTVKEVIKLARKGKSINSTMNKGITNYSAAEPTEQEAREILNQMKNIFEMEEKQMNFAVQNKSTFDKLHVAGMVKKNLLKSEESAGTLSKVMVQKSPPSLKEEAEALDSRSRKSFATTIAMYANAVGGEDQVPDKEDDSD